MNTKLLPQNCQLFCYSIILLLFFTSPLKAQVNIGSPDPPQPFSILELTTKIKEGGLRLPQLTTAQRENLTANLTDNEILAAKGLVVYDTDLDCLEFWNGGKWISLCANSGAPLPFNNPAVNIDPDTISKPGEGTLTGRLCFDIGYTDYSLTSCGSLASRATTKANFAQQDINTQVYTFTATTDASNVRYVVQETKDVLTGTDNTTYLSGTLEAGTLANGDSRTLTLNFRDNLNEQGSPIIGLTRDKAAHVTITIIYFDGSTDVKAASLIVNIQDCSCGCTVQSTLKDPPYNGWITFMCYNLGALAAVQSMSPYEQATNGATGDNYGDLYQWGRVADGHQSRGSHSYQPDDQSSQNTPVPDDDLDANGQVKSSSEAYEKFIKSNGDWHTTPNDNLWDFSMYPDNNPCPSGWRVPTATELQSIMNGNMTRVSSIPTTGTTGLLSGNTWVYNTATTPGWLITPTGSSVPTLFLPTAGCRLNGSSAVTNLGSFGYYWGSSFQTGLGSYLYFSGSFVTPTNYGSRAFGYSIRCVAE